jgi:antitoxin CcdA
MNEISNAKQVKGKRSTNPTLRENLVQEARALHINLSLAAEEGIARAVAKAADARRVEPNRAATASYEAFVEKEGLILGGHQGVLSHKPARLEVSRLHDGWC